MTSDNRFREYIPERPLIGIGIDFGFFLCLVMNRCLKRSKWLETNALDPIIPESVKYRVR